jgi:hypothetical protein
MTVLRYLAFVALFVVATPSMSAGDTLSFKVSGAGELLVTFGLDPFELAENAEGEAVLVFDPFIYAFFDSVVVTLVSGPLVDLDVDAVNGLTTYQYGAGTLTLDISAHRDDGLTAAGTALFPTRPFSFTVCEGCDTLFGGGKADDFEIALDPGVFDPALAALLGIHEETLGGTIDFGLEDISGDPASERRVAADHRGLSNLRIETREVPEPAALLLAIAGAGALLARRRTGRRA